MRLAHSAIAVAALVIFHAPVCFAMQDIVGGTFGPSLPGPTDYSAHADRAYYLAVAGDLRAAAQELTQAISVAPVKIMSRPDLISDLFSRRAQIWNLGGQPTAALQDCIAAIKLHSKNEEAYRQCYFAFRKLHEYRRAYEALEGAARVSKQHGDAYLNAMAWMMATCPDAKARDGKRAVLTATRACEAEHWKDWHTIDTLAAAYAEAGDFEKATTFQQRALNMVSSFSGDRKRIEQRVALYAAHQPYREANL